MSRHPNFEANFLARIRPALGDPRVPKGATAEGVLDLWGSNLNAYKPEHLQAAARWFLAHARWPESHVEAVEWMKEHEYYPITSSLALPKQPQNSLALKQMREAFRNRADPDIWDAILELTLEYEKNTRNKSHPDYQWRSPNECMNTEDYLEEAFCLGRITWDKVLGLIPAIRADRARHQKKLQEMFPNGAPAVGLQKAIYGCLHNIAHPTTPNMPFADHFTGGRNDEDSFILPDLAEDDQLCSMVP